MKTKTLNPEKFSFELYVGRQAISYLEIYDFSGCGLKPGVKLLGYCKADRLRVRPRTEGYAIMIELEDGTICWTHVGEYFFENESGESQKKCVILPPQRH